MNEDHGLPIPLRGFRIEVGGGEEATKYRKRLARLRYLSLSLFEKALKGELLHIDPQQISKDGSMAYATVPAVAEEDPRIQRATAQRVNINAGSLTGKAATIPNPFSLSKFFPTQAPDGTLGGMGFLGCQGNRRPISTPA
ncbi:MAG: hypothetical protein U0176_05040 [Bacteroidia bacterium]